MVTKHEQYILLVLQFKMKINLKILKYINRGKPNFTTSKILALLESIHTEYRELFITMHLHFHELTIEQITALFICAGNRIRMEYKLRKILEGQEESKIDIDQIYKLHNQNEDLCNREILTYVENNKLYNLPKIKHSNKKFFSLKT